MTEENEKALKRCFPNISRLSSWSPQPGSNCDPILTLDALWSNKLRITASNFTLAVLTYHHMVRSSVFVFLVLLAFYSTCSAGRAL